VKLQELGPVRAYSRFSDLRSLSSAFFSLHFGLEPLLFMLLRPFPLVGNHACDGWRDAGFSCYPTRLFAHVDRPFLPPLHFARKVIATLL
jgi:hypothetical protein